jgi:hypothetical protein
MLAEAQAGESYRRHVPHGKILAIREEIADEVAQAPHEFMRRSATPLVEKYRAKVRVSWSAL